MGSLHLIATDGEHTYLVSGAPTAGDDGGRHMSCARGLQRMSCSRQCTQRGGMANNHVFDTANIERLFAQFDRSYCWRKPVVRTRAWKPTEAVSNFTAAGEMSAHSDLC